MVTIIVIWLIAIPALVCLAALAWRPLEERRVARRLLLLEPGRDASVGLLEERRRTAAPVA